MSSPERAAADRAAVLLDVARRSIEHGISEGRPLVVDVAAFAPELREPRASFVTLRIGGALRGCVGALEAIRPLVADVAHSAFSAAFRDSRFPPVSAAEVAQLDIHVSVLSPLERVAANDEAELLAQVRPGIDGLLLRSGSRQGTFLPDVWKTLPEPRDFVAELKQKAGLAGEWSADWQVYRYTTESFPA